MWYILYACLAIVVIGIIVYAVKLSREYYRIARGWKFPHYRVPLETLANAYAEAPHRRRDAIRAIFRDKLEGFDSLDSLWHAYVKEVVNNSHFQRYLRMNRLGIENISRRVLKGFLEETESNSEILQVLKSNPVPSEWTSTICGKVIEHGDLGPYSPQELLDEMVSLSDAGADNDAKILAVILGHNAEQYDEPKLLSALETMIDTSKPSIAITFDMLKNSRTGNANMKEVGSG